MLNGRLASGSGGRQTWTLRAPPRGGDTESSLPSRLGPDGSDRVEERALECSTPAYNGTGRDGPAGREGRSVELPQNVMTTIEAELGVPLATVRLVRFESAQPADDDFLVQDAHRLDLSLTPRPRNARACYPEHWSPHRFERLGDVLFVPEGQLMHVRGDPSRRTSINCFLHAGPIRALFEDDLEWTDRRLDASLDISSTTIRSLMLRLGEEAQHPGFASPMLAELIATQLVIELFRYGSAIISRPATGGLAPWQLRIIDERLAEPHSAPTLAELAGLCRLSVRGLTGAFRASRGCSIGEWVTRSQINHAKRLLVGDENIKSIAYSMGFASPSSFSYAFRRATGQTPRQFRQSELRIGK